MEVERKLIHEEYQHVFDSKVKDLLAQGWEIVPNTYSFVVSLAKADADHYPKESQRYLMVMQKTTVKE